jgi:NTP pyrophosphatase (non-canonical NTP hydrolase)
MEATTYQALAMRTASRHPDPLQRLINGALGLCGEAGEVADLVKKAQFQGHPLETHKVAEELGDVLWYAALVCDALGMTMSEVMEANIDKLRRRYPDGFSREESVNRDDA